MIRQLGDAWDRFWFRPTSTATLGVFRIVYGLVLTIWTISLFPDAVAFFSSEGVLPERSLTGWQVTLLAWADSPSAVLAFMAVLLVAAICITLGYRTRLATVVSFVILVSLRRRNILVMNGGDSLLRHLGFFLMLSPAGAALSLDRWRTARDRFWELPKRAPWALRLMQIQVSIVYLFTVWIKAQGERWNAGTAVSESIRVGDLARFDLPLSFTDSLLLANVLTFGTMAVELALAILIWHRPARPYVIAAGVALHLFIEATMALGFFSTVMIMSYLTFVPEDAMDDRVQGLRAKLADSRNPRLRMIGLTGTARAASASTTGPGEVPVAHA